jgi:predicted transposase/invertase (TIGR01784 family)
MQKDFISPLDDDVIKRLYGDQKNIGNTVGLLKPALGIPPEEYDRLLIVDPSLRRRWKRRWEKDKLGILDIRVATTTGRIVDVEVQVRAYKLMLPRLVYYHAALTVEQMKAGFDYDQIHQTITLIISEHTLLPEEPGYLNTFELRNSATGRLFTDLQKYVIVELSKLPEEDGNPLWPQLRFLHCKTREEMEMLAQEHPEVRPLVAEYKRMTLGERFRWWAKQKEKNRRDTWAALEYAKDEGRDEIRAEMGKELAEKDREIAELRRQLGEKGR